MRFCPGLLRSASRSRVVSFARARCRVLVLCHLCTRRSVSPRSLILVHTPSLDTPASARLHVHVRGARHFYMNTTAALLPSALSHLLSKQKNTFVLRVPPFPCMSTLMCTLFCVCCVWVSPNLCPYHVGAGMGGPPGMGGFPGALALPHACVCVCVCVCMCVRVCVLYQAFVFRCLCCGCPPFVVRLLAHELLRPYPSSCSHPHTSTYTHMHRCTRAATHTHAHTHMHRHTRIPASRIHTLSLLSDS